jgi:hypothetical protein
MKLFQVPPSHICKAWGDGAYNLGKATDHAKREITPDQLKLLLLRGERTLLGIADDSDIPQAWAAVQIQTLPNLRTLFVYALYAPGATSPEAFKLLAEYGRSNGCMTIRGCCIDPIGRIWERRFEAKKLYSTYEIEIDEGRT